ncbi:MAG: Flp pilus assembly complex ATPase component TadA [Planctomycetes bacterium]|nr:Flp pilus assembly complex ATPase component TadA [Planctomycetota bacterium]MBI3832770.1 Flp pilus assembly complex ATPase component TadA [Planctomycetota bacterium]
MAKLTIETAVRLGEQLVRDGLITPEQLAEALSRQKSGGGRIGQALVESGAITSTALVQALSRRLGVKGCVLRHGLIDPKIAKSIPKEEAERLKVLPLFRIRDEMTVAMVEPQSLPMQDRLEALTDCSIRPVLVLEENLAEYQQKYLAAEVTVDSFLASMEESDVRITENEAIDEGPVTDLDRMVEGSPVINLVNLMILTALRAGASDVHIEPDRDGTHVRYRIDGQLREMLKPPKGMHAALVSRVKVIGRMDIAEKRLPQEGRVHLVADRREIDLRVSSMPTILGEKIVLRILDKANISFELDTLGIRGADRQMLEGMVRSPYGLILVTGPTGSGKTTTLYSCLDLLRDEATNIVTIEDPVEYQLSIVNQIQVNERVGLNFVRALRSILRQDPDVIMVGEIRDQETARVAIQSALTGHLVLSTLHTNDCPGSVMRLIDMGIEPYLISSSVLGFVAQRLARTICASCKTSYYPPHDLLKKVGWAHRTNELFQQGEGCRECNNTGFRGRVGIYEVMVMDHELKRIVQQDPSETDIRVHLAEIGWRTLREKALDLVDRGDSTLEEVLSVTRAEALAMDESENAGGLAEPAARSGVTG